MQHYAAIVHALADGQTAAGSQMAIIIVVIVAVLVLVALTAASAKHRGVRLQYHYRARTSVMTRREERFYRTLTSVLGPGYLVFPQMHLSALLDWRIKGQNWNAARSSINGKSVDYAVVEAGTLTLLCAIELDDPTHDRPDRVERDRLVEAIFKDAGLPLVRFREPEEMDDRQIRDAIFSALRRMKP